MRAKPKIAALVPMRHHSVRVPEKNFRELAGKPLYWHILETLSTCKEINLIAVDTDSPVIIAGLAEHFPQVKVIKRPKHLTADTVPMNEILMYDTGQVGADWYLQTHSTNPLLSAETISKGIRKFMDAWPAYDSMFSVTRVQTRLWDGLTRPVNHNPSILLRTQDLPPIYEENSCMYLFSRHTLELQHNRIGIRPLMFEIDSSEALDIDEQNDFLVADLMLRHQLSARKPKRKQS